MVILQNQNPRGSVCNWAKSQGVILQFGLFFFLEESHNEKLRDKQKFKNFDWLLESTFKKKKKNHKSQLFILYGMESYEFHFTFQLSSGSTWELSFSSVISFDCSWPQPHVSNRKDRLFKTGLILYGSEARIFWVGTPCSNLSISSYRKK